MRLVNGAIILLGSLLPLAAAGPLPVGHEDADAIPQQYIVTLNDGITQDDVDSHSSWVTSLLRQNLALEHTTSEPGGILNFFNIESFNAYFGTFDDKTVEEIRANTNVASVHQDRYAYANDIVTQNGSPWGLARISQKTLGPENYYYNETAGNGSYAYVVDTGVYVEHADFEGRASLGYNAFPGSEHEDDDGHGTHVAGTIASKTFGVAKKANVISVKALDDGRGPWSSVIDGIQWAVNDIIAKDRSSHSVINLSLGGKIFPPVNRAVENAIKLGITVVAAAGNSNINANQVSPASVESVIAVGSTSRNDSRALSSNFGDVLDVFAPGNEILSTWIGSRDATRTISGTSMAAPHVAGLVAYLQSLEDLPSPKDVVSRLIELSTLDKVVDPKGSPNRIVYNGDGLE